MADSSGNWKGEQRDGIAVSSTVTLYVCIEEFPFKQLDTINQLVPGETTLCKYIC